VEKISWNEFKKVIEKRLREGGVGDDDAYVDYHTSSDGWDMIKFRHPKLRKDS
jgi:hypothetical protein